MPGKMIPVKGRGPKQKKTGKARNYDTYTKPVYAPKKPTGVKKSDTIKSGDMGAGANNRRFPKPAPKRPGGR